MTEDRSRVAAATAAVVPFHCVICFEEFCLKQRLPVILPCGHTYVCAPCTKRLKRCMECREPLFYTVNKPITTAGNGRAAPPAPSMYSRGGNGNNNGGRYSPTPSTPPQSSSFSPLPNSGSSSSVQVPLPIPKNVVLISMMEAAERQASERTNSVNECQDDTNGSMNASDEDEEYDLNQIISGMATLSGPCGTYAVKESEGLTLITPDQPAQLNKAESSLAGEEPKLDVSASGDSIEIKEVNALEKGQTVQVVSFENGMAILARGAGYILANPWQLVKIGGPLEKSCRLEGLLDTVINRGKDLQKELDENNRIEESIRREIEAELQAEPSYPVVTEAPRLFEDLSRSSSGDADEPSTPRSFKNDSAQHYPRTPEVSPDFIVIDGRPTELRDFENAAFPFRSNSADNADACSPGFPGYRRAGMNKRFDETGYGYACGADILGDSGYLFTKPENDMIESSSSRRDRSNSSDGGHHPGLGPTLTSSFDTIDFRTGMSGHRGLTNTKLNPGHSPTPRVTRMMMSEHRGIGRARGPLQRSSASNSPV